MSAHIKPFQINRYEYEQRHIYYLPPAIMAVLESPKPAYIVGTRGTGKTTLLKSLEWRERLSNPSLHRQVGNAPFHKRYIGSYLKLPDFQLRKLEEKLPQLYKDAAEVLFALYVDLISIQPLCLALDGLAARDLLNFTPKQERDAVVTLLSDFTFLQGKQSDVPVTLRALKSLLHSAQRQLENAVLHGQELHTNLLQAVGNIGEMGRAAAEQFGRLCNEDSMADPWHFKVCMDEADSLGTFGTRVLNTMVRTSRAPLMHVAAFVSPPKTPIETLNPNLTLTDDDRSLIRLGDLKRKEFRQLSEGVATARICEVTGISHLSIHLNRILGELDLEGLALSALEESLSPLSKQLIQNSERDQSDVLKVFLEAEVKRQAPPESAPFWEKQREDSAFIRKAKVAAYLTLCRRLKTSPRYASGAMVVEMSDHCIRDLLRFLNEIYIECGATPESFPEMVVQPKVQDTAIKRASKIKVDCLNESGVQEPKPTHRIVDALAHITAELQATGRDNSNFRTTERGKFVVRFEGIDEEEASWLKSLLSDANDVGFLIILNQDEQKWRFRVHKSLAAHYGFSYRGAYYNTKISAQDLLRLAKAPNQTTFRTSLLEITRALVAGDAADTPLFDMREDEH